MNTQPNHTAPIAPPETLTMRQRRHLADLTAHVEGRKYITIAEFATLMDCSNYHAGQTLKGCRYLSIGLKKQYNLSDVAGVMARNEKVDFI